MPDYYETDCWCYCCGKRHKHAVDFDKPPEKRFGRYVTLCRECNAIPPDKRKAAMADWCRELRAAKPRKRRR